MEVQVTGDYYGGDYEGVLTIYDPSLGFTTGGGWFYWPGSPNQDTGYLGDKTNFGFNMKYNKKGANPQGSVLMIRHLQDGRIIRLKSNSVTGLSLGEVTSVPMGWASITGKSTFFDPLLGMTQPAGNYPFILYVEDRDEPGTGIDRVWVQVKDGAGATQDDLSRPTLASDIANSVQ